MLRNVNEKRSSSSESKLLIIIFLSVLKSKVGYSVSLNETDAIHFSLSKYGIINKV